MERSLNELSKYRFETCLEDLEDAKISNMRLEAGEAVNQ